MGSGEGGRRCQEANALRRRWRGGLLRTEWAEKETGWRWKTGTPMRRGAGKSGRWSEVRWRWSAMTSVDGDWVEKDELGSTGLEDGRAEDRWDADGVEGGSNADGFVPVGVEAEKGWEAEVLARGLRGTKCVARRTADDGSGVKWSWDADRWKVNGGLTRLGDARPRLGPSRGQRGPLAAGSGHIESVDWSWTRAWHTRLGSAGVGGAGYLPAL